MSRFVIVGALALLGFVQTGVAAEERDSDFLVTPRIGQGELRIDAFEGVNNERADQETYGIGISFGVLTPVGITIELGADSQGRMEMFDEDDDFSLTERYVALGYQIPLGDGWLLTPRVARTRWKLHSDNSLLDFNSSDNDEIRGYEYVYDVTIGRKVSKILSLGLNYKQGDFDFGRARALSFLVQFGF